ncbi:BOLA class I histocompatibility antigen, alpha chain BL3-6-like [Astyanax mexicanus]|nr:BOLA class I histocompatibility antigen, alpha chain BL3-6-like [Astyanax mexicanus]
MIKTLIFLIFTTQLTSATISLQYYYTGVTPGISFPEFTATGQLNEHQIGYYNTTSQRVIVTADWINRSKDEEHWKMMGHHAANDQELVRVRLANQIMLLNQTEGVHTWQERYVCELDDDGTRRGYKQFGYDGEDFLSLDVNDEYWTAATPQAVPFKRKWDGLVSIQKKILETECFERIKKYVEYGKSVFERKVAPEVSLFQKDSSSPVVCHATGFFPKAVMVSWEKNGEDLNEDVELRETLPNQDGSFQKRSILTLSPEELNRNKYTCVVQHEGLKKEIILQVSDRRVLSDKGSVGIMVGIIIGVVLAVLLLGILGFAGGLMWKKRKKNSDFSLPVIFTSASAQDSQTPAPTQTPGLDAVAAPH